MQPQCLDNLWLGRGAARWRGKLPIPQHVHPLVRFLYEEMNRQKTTITEVAEKAGLNPSTISNWRYRTVPKIDLIEAALNSLDVELCTKRRRVA